MNRRFNQFIFKPVLTLLLVAVFGLFSACSSGENDAEQFQVRAIWVDPPGYADRETVDNFIEKCKRAGINMLLPDVMIRGDIYFKSDNFKGRVHADDQYDPLGYLIERAHAEDIEVHAWSCTYYSEPNMPEWKMRPLLYDKYNVSYISPAHPEVNPYLLSVFEDLLKYDLDGVHLDYIRYWNAAYDYSDVARERFASENGFDPINFINHPEKIVSAEEEPYPVRVLLPESFTDQIPTQGVVERNMNRSYPGFAYIFDEVERIDGLRSPGMLIVSYYNEPSEEIMEAINRYVERGGDLLWMEPSANLFENFPHFAKLSGVDAIEPLYHRPMELTAAEGSPLSNFFEPFAANSRWNRLKLNGADAVALLGSSEIAVSYRSVGEGSVGLFGFPALNSNNNNLIDFLTLYIEHKRSDTGVNDEPLLAQKRREWIDWRAKHINSFVSDVNKLAKQKSKKIKMSAAAGIGAQQYAGVYRDGAYWLDEGLCDFIFPMNYSDNILGFLEKLDEQDHYMSSEQFKKIYPGLQIYKHTPDGVKPLDADIVKEQLEIVKEKGYRGYCLFAYSYFSDEIVDVLEQFNKQ